MAGNSQGAKSHKADKNYSKTGKVYVEPQNSNRNRQAKKRQRGSGKSLRWAMSFLILSLKK